MGWRVPEYTRRGLGTRILEFLESRAETLHHLQRPDLPGQLKLWIESTRAGTSALATSRDYRTWRWFIRMQRPMSVEVSEPDQVDGYRIRKYESQDAEPLRLACNEAFSDHWGSAPQDQERWRANYLESTSFRPDLTWVAVDADGQLAAFVMSSVFDAETQARGYVTGYVDRVGTTRAARGKGLASALLLHALQSYAEQGFTYAELGVDADSPTGAGRIYERAGFTVLAKNRVAGRDLAPATGPKAATPAH